MSRGVNVAGFFVPFLAFLAYPYLPPAVLGKAYALAGKKVPLPRLRRRSCGHVGVAVPHRLHTVRQQALLLGEGWRGGDYS